jgi:hypothetical protein
MRARDDSKARRVRFLLHIGVPSPIASGGHAYVPFVQVPVTHTDEGWEKLWFIVDRLLPWFAAL